MKKSPVKTLIKSIFITLGILCFLYGLLNPLVYYFGTETAAVCDNIDYAPSASDEIYDFDVDYHFFVSGTQYNGNAQFSAPYSEEFFGHTSVKYMPFLPFFNVIDMAYQIPLANFIVCGSGILLLIIGILIKSRKKEISAPSDSEKTFTCPICRGEIDSDSIYCSHCGRKLVH